MSVMVALVCVSVSFADMVKLRHAAASNCVLLHCHAASAGTAICIAFSQLCLCRSCADLCATAAPSSPRAVP
jgi:hypothetical protein